MDSHFNTLIADSRLIQVVKSRCEITLQDLHLAGLASKIVEVWLPLFQVKHNLNNFVSVCILPLHLLDNNFALRTGVFAIFGPSFDALVAVKMRATVQASLSFRSSFVKADCASCDLLLLAHLC